MLQSNSDAIDKNFEYTFPSLEKTALERAKIHKIIPVGQAGFKQGIVIPVFGITIEDPMGEGLLSDFQSCTVNTCSFKMSISTEQAGQLVMYQVSGVGMFLAPKA